MTIEGSKNRDLFLFAYTAACLISLIGVVFGTYFVLSPLIKKHRVEAWPKIECEILTSEIRTHKMVSDNNNSFNYSINTSFSYDYEGQIYKSNTYDFINEYYDDKEDAKSVLNTIKSNSKTMCYVNPQKPSQAYIATKLYKPIIRFGQSLTFIITGAVIIFLVRQSQLRYEKIDNGLSSNERNAVKTYSPHKRGAIYVCGAIVSVLISVMYLSFCELEVIYKIIFVIVIISSVLIAIRSLYRMWILPITMTLCPVNITIGETLKLEWAIKGPVNKISSIHLAIISDKNISQNNESVYKLLYTQQKKITGKDNIKSGTESFIIPDTDEVVNAVKLKARWLVQLKAYVKGMADIQEDYVFEVYPKQ